MHSQLKTFSLIICDFFKAAKWSGEKVEVKLRRRESREGGSKTNRSIAAF